MSTVTLHLPDDLHQFLREQAQRRGHDDVGSVLTDILRQEVERERVRRLILDGMASGDGGPVDDAFFQQLEARIAAGEGDPRAR